MVLGIVTAAYLLCPKPHLENRHPRSRAYFDTHGRLLRLALAADERYRLPCPLKRISPRLIEATLLYEDKDFYRHRGVDPAALARAFWSTYVDRSRRVGGSTITMQVARLHWRLRTSTPAGKLVQILRAVQLARHYDKGAILQAYLNLAPYGGNIEGIQAASLIYFNKTADRLTLPEALTLAVVPQNPVRRNPATPEGFATLTAARQTLFDRWQKAHPKDRQRQVFLDLPLAVRPASRLPFAAPHFVDHLDTSPRRPAGPLIATTVDLDRQRTMQAVIGEYVRRRGPDGIANAAALCLDTRTMAVTAMVGSADFFDPAIQGQVNGTTAKRSPGSALKPFVYALAMDQGLIHPMSLMKDAPRRFGGFTPENFDQRFLGPVSAHDALILSRNVPAANLQARLADPGFHGFLQRAGIAALEPADFYGLALSLGGVEVTMLELASLYAALANDGERRPIRMLADAPPTAASNRILSPESSFLVLDILRDNPPPGSHTRPLAAAPGRRIAWKTGTSHGFRDAWAVGVSARTVIAVWVGNFDGRGNRAFIGRSAAGPLLFDLFATLVPPSGRPATDEIDPAARNLKRVTVCAATGDLPGRHCPHTRTTWFIPGVSPIRVCTVHRAAPVNPETGKRACRHTPGLTRMQVFEFWPTDLLAVFRSAGIALAAPPPYDAGCTLDQRDADGRAPVITSPQPELVYGLQDPSPSNRPVAFCATADGDVRRLYWFVDDRYAGSVRPDQPLMWPPHSGRFEVRVVDDHGRADTAALRVEAVPPVPRQSAGRHLQ
jgi:penicillin-binding protein 1C